MDKKLYSIGQASEICAVSTRTFRFYESKGLIAPDKTSESGYRFYSMDTLRKVQIIRYCVEEGFSLEEIEQLLEEDNLEASQAMFGKQIIETKKQIEFYHNRLDSLKAWYSLFCEGKRVLQAGTCCITLKYIPTGEYFCYEDTLDGQDPDGEANLETKYFTSSKSDGHTMVDVGGSFMAHYTEYRSRIERKSVKVSMMQQLYPNAKSNKNTETVQGFTAVSIYHIGKLSDIDETYDKAVKWADSRGISLIGDTYERYVIDVYSSRNPEEYVTEILLPITMDNQDMELLNDSNMKSIIGA